MVRAFFAIRPPAVVCTMVAALPRPALDGVGWTPPERWIIKLRPLGHVAVELHEPLLQAVQAEVAGAPPAPVSLGPATRRYGGSELCAPVDGLDELSAAVFDATGPLVPVTHPQPFHAELVLASGRIPRDFGTIEVHARWTATEVLLIADRSSPRSVRLEDVGAIALDG